MRPGTAAELADRYGVTPPDWRAGDGFLAFLAAYDAAISMLRSADDIHRLVVEIAEDAAADGVVWVEPHVHPPHYAELLGSDEAVMEVLLDAALAAERRTGVGVGFLLTADRAADPADALLLARLAVTMDSGGVVGFGLAGNERGSPPEPFAEAFTVVADAGLLRVPHAGELEGPSSVRAAVDQLSAQRIAHGVRAAEDPLLVRQLADDGICLDVCPTSNVVLGVVDALEHHPLPELLEAGVPISLNADDPLLFGASLLDEYTLCRDVFAFDDVALAEVARASIESSGAPDGTKRAAIERLFTWMRSPASAG